MATYFSIGMSRQTAPAPAPLQPYDIYFVDDGEGGLVLSTVEDGACVAERVRQHLEFYHGEWFLDTDAGVEWLQRIFVEPFSREVAEALIKSAILDVPGVAEIIEFDVTVSEVARAFRVNRLYVRTTFNDTVEI